MGCECSLCLDGNFTDPGGGRDEWKKQDATGALNLKEKLEKRK